MRLRMHHNEDSGLIDPENGISYIDVFRNKSSRSHRLGHVLGPSGHKGIHMKKNDLRPTPRQPIVSRFIVVPVSPLPSIYTSMTVGAALLCRSDDDRLNSRIIKLTTRYEPLAYAATAVFASLAGATQVESNPAAARAYSIICFVVMPPAVMLHLSSLSRDLAILTLQTFEFWFLTALNITNLLCSALMFADERVLVAVSANLYFCLALMVDANIYSRRWLFRSFMMASCSFSVGITAMVIRYTPRTLHATIPIGNGAEMDVLDLSIHCSLTMAIFVTVKMFRSLPLVFSSRDPIKMIQCESYFPCCGLVPANQGPSGVHAPRLSKKQSYKRLKLIQGSIPHIVDAENSFIPFRRLQPYKRLREWLNAIGTIGLISSTAALYSHIGHAHFSGAVTTTQLALALGGLMATLLVGAMYIVQAPRVFLGRLLRSLDAWFVTFQFTVVTIGVCDTVQWDQRSLLVISMWVWCHWAMILDTLTPLTRRRLCFERWFARLVLATLLSYPIVVTYWVFYSGGPHLRNRVLLSFSLFTATVQMHSYSILVSRVWTVWLWMGRFLWREVFHPVDAFKLLKFPVQYRVDLVDDTSKPKPTAIHPNTLS